MILVNTLRDPLQCIIKWVQKVSWRHFPQVSEVTGSGWSFWCWNADPSWEVGDLLVWHPFLATHIHSVHDFSGLQIGWCRRLRPGRIYGFWCFCHVFDWRMEVNKNTSKWSCALGTGVDGLWAWGSCRCRKAWLRRYATGSSSEFARSPVK